MSLVILPLTIQTTAALVSLLGTLLVVSVVVYLFKTSSDYEEKSSAKAKVYRMRDRYFLGLALTILIVLITSLSMLPYPKFHKNPDSVVTVVAMQWLWKMAPEAIAADQDLVAFAGKNEITLPVDKLIEFRVTSADVNHNFAIYNSKGTLIAQTQAMPKYYNNLQYKFTEKGEYEVLCLEYCGMPHAYMVAKIHIE
ncbi:MAG: hypothetical protein LC107_07535 [Chitinophagales bacterium]|nr:hypothetical protein [Chitinophagales bacterium]